MKLNEARDDVLVKAYIDLRDRRTQRKADFDTSDASDKDKQEKIEAEFLRRFNDRGIDNVSARGIGTAYKSTRTSATVADWEALLGYIRQSGAWEMLERRVNKTAVEQYRAANEDIPPGVNVRSEIVVNFRRT